MQPEPAIAGRRVSRSPAAAWLGSVFGERKGLEDEEAYKASPKSINARQRDTTR